MPETLGSIDRPKLYTNSWALWFFQNLLLFLAMFLFIGSYFGMALAYDRESAIIFIIFHTLLNITVYVALLLDVIVISLIVFLSYLEGRNSDKKTPLGIEPLLIVISGGMWILTSVLWRIPFYLQGPLGQNFGPLGLFTVYLHGGEDQFFTFLFSSGSISLVVFLAIQDRYFSSPGKVPYKRSVYGLVVLLGNLIIVGYSGNPTFFDWILLLSWKLGVTPIVGMMVAKRVWFQGRPGGQNKESPLRDSTDFGAQFGDNDEESEVEDEKYGKTEGIGEGRAKSWIPWITLAFVLFRGVQVFSPIPAIPLITVWDLVALLLAGFYLALLKVQRYSKTIIILNFISWFAFLALPFLFTAIFSLPWAIIATQGAFTVYLLSFLGLIPLGSFLVSLLWLGTLKGRYFVKAIHSRLPPSLQKVAPEEFFGLLVICFITLAFFAPRVVGNSITYQYNGSQDVITSYLQLEFNPYFPEVLGIVESTCTGFAAFKLAPNYLGATERALYEQEILSSRFHTQTYMEITANTSFSLNALDEIAEIDIDRYRFAYSPLWKDKSYFFNSLPYDWLDTNLGNITWTGEQINVVVEYVRMDNMVGSDMQFWQYVAFLESNETVLVMMSGHIVSCYD